MKIYVDSKVISQNRHKEGKDKEPPIAVKFDGSVDPVMCFQVDIPDNQGNVVASVVYDPDLVDKNVYVKTNNARLKR